MINWKAQLKAFLVLALCCCYSNLATAGIYDNHEFQSADLNAIADWWIAQGGSIDDYFYSEVSTTGSDGSLGNEYICLRDDVNQTYVGRSDVCQNRALDASYTYIQIDKMDWSTNNPDVIYGQTGDIIGDNNWSGCYQYSSSPSWGGTSGGQCPNINTSSYQINFGYIQQTLSTIGAINEALKQAGVEVTGYNYSWRVKNADANYESTNGTRGQDPLYVTVKITDQNNNTVYEKTYDYSYHIDTWTLMTGSETFKEPLFGEELSEVELLVTAKDAGYWAGWYGPEFDDPSIKLNYRVATVEDTTVEDLLFSQMCQQDPLYDINCPGYQQAMLDAIAEPTSTGDFFSTDINLSDPTTDGLSDDFDNLTEPVAMSESITEDNVAEIDNFSGLAEDVSGANSDIADAPNENDAPVDTTVEEVADEPAEEVEERESIAEEQSTSGSSSGPRLNATQLAALDAANNAATSAVSVAGEQSQISASVGLSETGGVSSTLTSDGVTNEQGVTSSMANIIAGTPGGTSSLSFSTQDTSNSTTSPQQLSQDTASSDVTTAQSGGAVVATATDTEQQSVQSLESNDQSQTMNIDGGTTDTQMFVFDNNQEQSADSFVDIADPSELTQSFELQDFTGTIDTGVSTAENQDFGLEQQLADQAYVEHNDADSMQDAINTTEMYAASADEQQIDMSTLTGSEDNSNGIPDELMQTEIFDFAEGEITGTQQDFATTDQIMTDMEQQEQNTGEEFAVIDAVETEDITGEEALAQANELTEQASMESMLPTVNTIPMLSELDFVGRFVADFVASLPELPPVQEAENKTEEEQKLEAFREAVLLAKAGNGDDSEDAKAAQLGYNPNFSAYATVQMKDSEFYKDKEIYTNKKNYDNPSSKLFDAASDQRHKELVDLQYNKEN